VKKNILVHSSDYNIWMLDADECKWCASV